MLKAFTQAIGLDGKEFRTTNVRLTCAENRIGTWITVERELGTNEIGLPTSIRVVVGSKTLQLQRLGATDGIDQYSTLTEPKFVRAALAQGKMSFIEAFSPSKAQRQSREVTLLTDGLEQALQTRLKDCGGRH